MVKYKTIVAMVRGTAIELVALACGITGAMMPLSVAALAGLGGYELTNLKPPTIGETQ